MNSARPAVSRPKTVEVKALRGPVYGPELSAFNSALVAPSRATKEFLFSYWRNNPFVLT